MKFLRYLLLGIFAYLLFMVLLFPVSMVVSRVKLDPIKLSDVSGQLWNGSVAKIETANVYLPTGPENLQIEDISWQLAPTRLLNGAGAVKIDFSAYGGNGSGLVEQSISGIQAVRDLVYAGNGSGLSVLMDPFVKIGGEINLQVKELILENQILKSMQGTLVWNNATLEIPTSARLGNITLDIRPKDNMHIADVLSEDGDLDISGQVEMENNGNFKSDITIKTRNTTPQALKDMLRAVARPASNGSFRIRRSGNINRMM